MAFLLSYRDRWKSYITLDVSRCLEARNLSLEVHRALLRPSLSANVNLRAEVEARINQRTSNIEHRSPIG